MGRRRFAALSQGLNDCVDCQGLGALAATPPPAYKRCGVTFLLPLPCWVYHIRKKGFRVSEGKGLKRGGNRENQTTAKNQSRSQRVTACTVSHLP